MDWAYNIIDVLKTMAKQKQVLVAQLTLAWLLRQPRVTSDILETRKISQIEDNL